MGKAKRSLSYDQRFLHDIMDNYAMKHSPNMSHINIDAYKVIRQLILSDLDR
jgi:hypothetical protein